MQRHLVLIRIVLVVVVLGLVIAPLRAQQGQEPIGFSALTLTLDIPDRRLLPLEPIPMRLVLENRTGRSVVGHTVLHFDSGRIRLLVQPDGSEAYAVDDLSVLSSPMFITGRAIQPGERHEVTEVLAVKLDKIFPSPGRYRIQVVLAAPGRRGEVRSNAVPIQVEEPTGLDQAARAYIEGTGAASSFLSGAYDDDQLSQLEEFAAQFADTAYGGYANLILAQRQLARREYEKARGFLSRAAANPKFPLAARAAQRLTSLPRQ